MAEPRTYSGNGHTATIADPENITRDECLALARCGAGEWNKWRDEFPVLEDPFLDQHGNCADFHGIDFRLIQSNFGFVDFRFGDFANFSQTKFGNQTSFRGAIFGRRANFSYAEFGDEVDFVATRFGGHGSFYGAIFGENSAFDFACFLVRLQFTYCSFGRHARFWGTLFGDWATFDGSVFKGDVLFCGKEWTHLKLSLPSHFEDLKQFSDKYGLAPNRFSSASFAGASFEGCADFSGRLFEGPLRFGPLELRNSIHNKINANAIAMLSSKASNRYDLGMQTSFALAPRFHGCTFHQDTNFDATSFPSPSGDLADARAFRALKLAFSKQQATREEQRFFRLEMAEEAKAAERSHDPAKWIYIAYRELADFGFSVRRPALLLAATLLLMLPLYAWQAGLQACWPSSAGCGMTGPLIQFASAHALPGFEKLAEPASKTLFGDHLGVWTVLTLLLHKAVSVLALFLIGLALRNLFKMK